MAQIVSLHYFQSCTEDNQRASTPQHIHFFYLAAPSFQWHECAVWQQQHNTIPPLSSPIPSDCSEAFVSALWGFCVHVMSHQHIQNAPSLQQVPNCSTELARRLLTTARRRFMQLVCLSCCNVEGFDESKGGVGAYGQSDYKQLSEVTVLCSVWRL